MDWGTYKHDEPGAYCGVKKEGSTQSRTKQKRIKCRPQLQSAARSQKDSRKNTQLGKLEQFEEQNK